MKGLLFECGVKPYHTQNYQQVCREKNYKSCECDYIMCTFVRCSVSRFFFVVERLFSHSHLLPCPSLSGKDERKWQFKWRQRQKWRKEERGGWSSQAAQQVAEKLGAKAKGIWGKGVYT